MNKYNDGLVTVKTTEANAGVRNDNRENFFCWLTVFNYLKKEVGIGRLLKIKKKQHKLIFSALIAFSNLWTKNNDLEKHSIVFTN